MSDDSSYAKRMRALSRFDFGDHRDASPEDLRRAGGVNRKERRARKKAIDKRVLENVQKVRAILKNGSGLTSDDALREFLAEYNHRLWSHGLGVLPSSFNVVEAFLQFHPEGPWFGLREERDHLFLPEDFLDYATSASAPADVLADLAKVPEGVIHSYTVLGSPKALTFSHSDGRQYVIGSFSFVRHHDELSWLTVGGWITDLASETATLLGPDNPSRKELLKDNSKRLDLKDAPPAEAVAMPGTSDAWRTLLYGRFNLASRKHEVRYLARDQGDSYSVQTDDPQVFYRFSGGASEAEKILDRGAQTLRDEYLLTEISETLFGLPSYFRFKVQLVREREVQSHERAHPRNSSQSSSSGRVQFRKVSALEILNPSADRPIRTYTPPRFKVEVEGFWRRLSDSTAKGRGPDGKVELGRTWVTQHMRWRDRPADERTVYVKSSVAVAKARAAAAAVSNNIVIANIELPELVDAPEPSASSSGFVYVMRCPAMDGDIFKVGRTNKTPEDRALELSKGTGVPMFFVVVQSWACEDAAEVERLSHMALAQFRITSRREFFRAKFEVIRAAIEGVLGQAASR